MKRRSLVSLLVLIQVVVCGALLHAQEGLPFGPNNAGREFFLAFPANWDNPAAAQTYIRLYITSAESTQVRVWAGPTLHQTITTVPYGIVTVDLPTEIAQMFTRTDSGPVPADQIYRRRAIYIEADEPVIVYGINRTTYTSDGLLALPVNALGMEYVVASYAAVTGGAQELPSQFMIIAPYDSTLVTIRQPMQSQGHGADSSYTILMDRGDVYSAMSIGAGGDLSGAVISADKPVAVTAGQNCTYIPNQITFCCCDHLTEMMLPVSSWGKVYHAVPFATRLKGDIYRIFAGEDNTTVHVNGVQVAVLPRRGGGEGIGWMEYQAISKGVIRFTADKPIAVAQFNPSQAYDGVASDPFYMMLTPEEQHGKDVVFSTPSGDFPQNYVNVVCDSAGYDSLEIAHGESAIWRRVSTLPGGIRKNFMADDQGRIYSGVTFEIQPGTYRLRGSTPFAGYLYGFSQYDSYGYPISAFTGDLEANDTTPPGIIIGDMNCDGSISGRIVDGSGDPGSARLSVIDMLGGSNYAMKVDPFVVGVTAEANYTLRVLDTSREARAVIAAADMAGNITIDTLVYMPLRVAAGNPLVGFGELEVGSSARQMVMITNNSKGSVRLTGARLRNGTSGFSIVAPLDTTILAPGTSLDLEIEFAPAATGIFRDTLVVAGDCGDQLAVSISGAGEEDDPSSVPLPGRPSLLASMQIHPNPASDEETMLFYTLPEGGRVTIGLSDALGRSVRVFKEEEQSAGERSIPIDLRGLPEGTYFVSISWNGEKVSRSLVLAR